MTVDFKQLLKFYQDHTYHNLMAYWMKHVDPQHGGLMNCISNSGETTLHTHKFVWSQGRWAYTAARIYQDSVGDLSDNIREEYLTTARQTTQFLMRHARLENGNCAFVLSREGQPIRLKEDGGARKKTEDEVYDYSISADQFAYNGVAEYARVSGDRDAYDWAKDLHHSVEKRIKNGTARSDFPYPIPAGYKTHGRPMFLIENSQHLAQCAKHFGDSDFANRLSGIAATALHQVLNVFAQPDGLVLEMLGEDLQPVDTILGRYCNPGHTIEGMWFAMHQAMKLEDNKSIQRISEIIKATCERAWDEEFGGGIPQYMDRQSGGRPNGPIPEEIKNSVMVNKVQNLWDTKLWWPHSETLYALLLTYQQTKQPWALEWYSKFHDYTFATFPHPDKNVGEWIQIRNRSGKPEEATVALPVKDPMHIIRAFQLAINVLKSLAT
jgi:N-acylglucosamine 2-epimerase